MHYIPLALPFFLVLFLFFVFVVVPIAHMPPEHVLSRKAIDCFGMQYVIPPVIAWAGMVSRKYPLSRPENEGQPLQGESAQAE